MSAGNILTQKLDLAAAMKRFRLDKGWSVAQLARKMEEDDDRRVDLFERGQFKTESKIREVMNRAATALGKTEDDFLNFSVATGVIGHRIHQDLLRIGLTRTLWAHRVGHGRPIFWDDIKCKIVDREIITEPEFAKIVVEERRRIEADPNLFDGHQLALSRIDEYRSDNKEKEINIEFSRSRYSQFRAINVNPDGRNKRNKYLKDWSVRDTPIDWLSLGVGVHVCVITSDNKIVAVQRAKGVRVRESEFDFGVVEGISKHLDSAEFEHQFFSLENIFRRGAEEEFGIQFDDIRRLCCTGLGYDLYYAQWNFLGVMYLNITFEELSGDRFPKFAKTKFEIERIIEIKNEIDDIKKFMKPKRIWSSGIACIHFALIEDRMSISEVGRAFGGFKMDNSTQYIMD